MVTDLISLTAQGHWAPIIDHDGLWQRQLQGECLALTCWQSDGQNIYGPT